MRQWVLRRQQSGVLNDKFLRLWHAMMVVEPSGLLAQRVGNRLDLMEIESELERQLVLAMRGLFG